MTTANNVPGGNPPNGPPSTPPPPAGPATPPPPSGPKIVPLDPDSPAGRAAQEALCDVLADISLAIHARRATRAGAA